MMFSAEIVHREIGIFAIIALSLDARLIIGAVAFGIMSAAGHH